VVLVFRLLAREFAEVRGGHVGGQGLGLRSLEGWEDDLWLIYNPIFTDS